MTSLRAVACILALVLLPAHLAGAQDGAPAPATEPVALGKGVNISHWLWLPREAGDAFAARYITPQDAAQLTALGFSHARVPVDPARLWDAELAAVRADGVTQALAAIQTLTDVGLVVVLDVHPLDATWPNPRGAEGAQRLKDLWRGMAPQLAETDPAKVVLELCNEPHDFARPEAWHGLQRELITIVRASCPRHTIVLTGDKYGSIEGLLALEPVDDPNVIYSFHCYEPHSFTHQGATWGPEHWKALRHVPFPGIGNRMERAVRDAPAEARGAMQWYADERWTQGRLGELIRSADEWGERHGATIYCGEFGVYRVNSLEEDRERWLITVAGELNSRGIAWAMWDYAGGFALMEGEAGRREVHESTLRAVMRPDTLDRPGQP